MPHTRPPGLRESSGQVKSTFILYPYSHRIRIRHKKRQRSSRLVGGGMRLNAALAI